MTSIGATLLWCVIQVTAVAAAAVATYLLAFRGGATARAGVALAGLMTAAALAPLAFSPWPRWEGRSEVPAQKTTASADGAVPGKAGERMVNVARPDAAPAANVWSEAWAGFRRGLADPQPPTPVERVEPAPRGVRWPVVVAWLFVAAAAAGLLRLGLGVWAVRRSIRRAKPVYDPALFGLVDVLRAELSCPATVELRESAEVATAATAGWRKPVLLLPPDWRGWTEAERRAVVAHELAHVKRRDYLSAVVAQGALAVHFYHPLLHWLAGRVRLEQELAADALAASVSGGRAAYLRTLAELALRRSDGRVAWPARAFLPSRRTFLRRIEMLRDPRRAADRPAPLLRATVAGGLLLFGIVVAGVRPDPAAAQNPAPPATGGAAPPLAGGTDAAVLAADATQPAVSPVVYIPGTAMFVATLRPAALLDDPAVKPFAGQIEQGIGESKEPAWVALRDAGVTPRNVEKLAIGTDPPGEGRRNPQPSVAVRLKKPIDRGVIEKRSTETKPTFGGVTYRLAADAFVMIPDDVTVLIATDEVTLTAMVVGGHLNRAASPWTRIEEKLGPSGLAVLVDTETAVAAIQKEVPPGTPQAAMFMPVMPLLNDTKLAGISLNLGEGPGVKGFAECDDESAAKRVAETLGALLTLGKNTLRQWKMRGGERSQQEQALSKMFLPIAQKLLDSAKVESRGQGVTLTAEAGGSAAIALGLVLPAVQQAREAARRAVSTNNLKQIALAFHNYHDTYGYFPPAAIEEKGVTRSWRVEILPFIEQRALYDQYRKDLPWDSPENKRVLEQMPALFKDPSDSSGPTSTSYFVLTGDSAAPAAEGGGIGPAGGEGAVAGLGIPGGAGAAVAGPESTGATLFSAKPVDLAAGGKGPGIFNVTDGTSNTLLVVEAKRDVPWTKPEDIPFDPGKAGELLGTLGGNHGNGFIAAFADGAVRFIANAPGESVDVNVFKGLVTPAGGEVVGLSEVPGAP